MPDKLSYVLKNFFLIYNSPVPLGHIALGYGTDNGEKIFIPDLSGQYFSDKTIAGPSDFSWKEIKGTRIPFLFVSNGEETFYIENGRAVFNADIISSIFFFLSGWQEFVCTQKDHLGRFTYDFSIQKKLDILHLPVVHYYYDILKQAIEQVYIIKLENRLLSNKKFTICVTHDVDVWKTLWLKEGKHALRKGRIGQAITILIERFRGRHVAKSFEKIFALQQRYQFKSDFFFLPSLAVYKGEKNADYDVTTPEYTSFIKALHTLYPVGLHGSFTSSFDEKNLMSDKNKMPVSAIGYRSHYLMFDAETTPELLEKQGFEFDSTLGFNSHPGFRNGTAYPFYLYNFRNGTATSIIEFPHIAMDASLFYGHYLGLQGSSEAMSYLQPMLDELVKTGGVFTINWHNDTFAEWGREEWINTLEEILEFANENDGDFLSINEAYNRLTKNNLTS